MYVVEFAKKAQKQLNSLPTLAKDSLIAEINSLSTNPRPAGVKALKGMKGLLRLRVGDYKIIYQIEADRLLVLVVEIGHRREIYKKR